jgi:UDP-3-O-[3-hydroxymyristoyl] glucosamine N-acyltransferase
MPSLDSVVIGDGVTVFAHVVVYAGVLGDTVIRQACALDSHVLIGHDSVIGAHWPPLPQRWQGLR